MLWIKFLVFAAIVIFSGYKLCIYGDKIGEIIKLGRTFVGLILLAVVTSLPELAVSLSAAKIGAIDLALGDVFGSNLFNLTIIGLLLLLFVRKPQQFSFESTHFISLGFSVVLVALAAVGIVFYRVVNPVVNYSRIWVDIETILILGVYILGAFLLFRLERKQAWQSVNTDTDQPKNKLKIWLQFVGFAVILVSSAVYLARLGNQIAALPVAGIALGGTFVGSLLMAIVTSLPEMAVAISAAKLGFWDMALGNIFGSNMFNMLIIGIIDLSIGPKIVLSAASPLLLFTVLFVLIASGLVAVSLVYRSRQKVSGLAWDSVSLLLLYFAANVTNFYLR
ncbi:sodium:calcium antiporter [Candidatus Omnitrophota bacterium]